MNDFEIVRDYIKHAGSIIGPVFWDLKNPSVDNSIATREALDRIEKEYKDLLSSYFHAKYFF